MASRPRAGSGTLKVRRLAKRDEESTPWQEFQKVFGENVKAARLKAGLKQSEVSAATSLTQQYLSLIEAGQQNLTLKTMALLADVLDQDLVEMLEQRGRRSRR